MYYIHIYIYIYIYVLGPLPPESNPPRRRPDNTDVRTRLCNMRNMIILQCNMLEYDIPCYSNM